MHRQTGGQKNKRATRELPEEDPEFQIAPMIDILLVLLVFFMSISSTQVLQTNELVKLPVAKDAKNAGDTAEGRVIVNVLWEGISNAGTIEISGRNFTSPADVQPLLQTEVKNNPNAQVLIRADKAVRYEYLRGILKTAAAAGVANVTFSVVNKD